MAFDIWIENLSPFEAGTHLQPDMDGQEVFVALFSASFDAEEDENALRPADSQLPILLADVPYGDPVLSSNLHEADIALAKPAAEVILNGTAYAPNGKPTREMQVGLRVGSIRKVLNVVGDRIYDAGGYSAPNPFQTMPVIYERAYGGTTADGKVDQRNPVGVGFHHARSADPAVRTQAPNITYPGEPFTSPSDRPRPAGFGPVGRGWKPRIDYAGTYDQVWIDTQWPLPPRDFDPRYNLCSPADQQLSQLSGSEDVSVIGLTPDGRWDFRLPRVVAPIHLIFDDRVEERSFQADTIVIEPDLRRVTLKARLSFVTRRNAPALRGIIFGHVTPALLVARRKQKAYLAPRSGHASLRDRPQWLP
ncbi:DUF2169 domain-containing protein [Mesorhizobium calcicola]|uniref:DUF2169 domain-containing protein n=1 Tax=Mesorhizobium calcicola TaxID=1300310 RepID=A0ABW4WIK5_9HYPH